MKNMPGKWNTYLVGGAVRDTLLEHPHNEKDWVVVGATAEDLLNLGYRQVGKDFPVFLHPQTNEEYALARTERKTGPGHTGFSCDSHSGVTLEQDLLRRDLTVNAMAQATDGTIVDPYGGQRDLEARCLRHVSAAFSEDPLRVLRTARFAARYQHLGFTIAPETLTLMGDIVANGELQQLPAERLWLEVVRALGEDSPRTFIEVLRQCGALADILPELDQLFGVPQPEAHHPEIDTGEHILLCLDQAVEKAASTEVRFAVLVHDLGKGTTDPEQWPRHIAHEKRGLKLVDSVCQRLKVPGDFRALARLSCKYHTHGHRALELRADTLLKLLENTDAMRRPERFEDFLLACEIDALGRAGLDQRDYPQRDYLRRALALCNEVDPKPLMTEGFTGKALGLAVRRERIARLETLRDER